MEITAYHAKYYAHELTKRCPADSIEKLAGALVDAQVDLNPHQVETRRGKLIEDVEQKLSQEALVETLFSFQ